MFVSFRFTSCSALFEFDFVWIDRVSWEHKINKDAQYHIKKGRARIALRVKEGKVPRHHHKVRFAVYQGGDGEMGGGGREVGGGRDGRGGI